MNPLRLAYLVCAFLVALPGCARAVHIGVLPGHGPGSSLVLPIEDGVHETPPDTLENTPELLTLVAASASMAPSNESTRQVGPLIIERSDPVTEGRCALTFDDGPHLTYTPRVLDLLAKHRLHATFFVVGQSINRRTFPLVRRMIAEGHQIGLHSYNHEIDMARRFSGAQAIAYMVGQHAATHILVEISLLSSSEEEFDALTKRVFHTKPFELLSPSTLLDHDAFSARYDALLVERGYQDAARPLDVRYARPPGGGEYLSTMDSAARRASDAALVRYGLVNVLWHGTSGDTDESHGKDVGYLADNLRNAARQGGVVLVHEAIEPGALSIALSQIRSDRRVSVVSVDEITRDKYGVVSWARTRRIDRKSISETPPTPGTSSEKMGRLAALTRSVER